MYPPTTKQARGKLRLLFECNPLAFIAEQAGGKASSGEVPIMDLVPKELHERTPIYIGSTDMVDKVEEMLRKAKVGEALL
jgi:fructose-1,6-bisphosphatase I